MPTLRNLTSKSGFSADLEATVERLSLLVEDQEHRLRTLEWELKRVLYAEPPKLRDGMFAVADGTTWNPGSGAGLYRRAAGAWVKL